MSWTKHHASPVLVPPPNSVIPENLHQQHLNRYWSNGMCHVLHVYTAFLTHSSGEISLLIAKTSFSSFSSSLKLAW